MLGARTYLDAITRTWGLLCHYMSRDLSRVATMFDHVHDIIQFRRNKNKGKLLDENHQLILDARLRTRDACKVIQTCIERPSTSNSMRVNISNSFSKSNNEAELRKKRNQGLNFYRYGTFTVTLQL